MKQEASGFNERIKRLIGAAGSQRKLAEMFGVSPPAITGWAAGSEPFESTFHRIAERTGLSAAWLMSGDGDEVAEIDKIRQRAGKSLPPGARGVLRAARETAGLSYAELAKKTGRRTDYLRSLEEGTAPISEQTAELISAAIPGLSKDTLMEGSDAPRIFGVGRGTYGTKPGVEMPPGMKGRHVPLLSMAQAGAWDAGHSDTFYDYETVFAAGLDDRNAFAVKVMGTSMEPRMFEGDILICSSTAELNNGDCAVVRTKSEQSFIKFWKRRGDRVSLESANPEFAPIVLPVTEIARAVPVVQRIEFRKVRSNV